MESSPILMIKQIGFYIGGRNRIFIQNTKTTEKIEVLFRRLRQLKNRSVIQKTKTTEN